MPRVRGDLGSEKKGLRSSTLMLTLIGGVMRQRAGLQMCDVASHQVVDIFAAQPINHPINRRTTLLRTAATAAMMPLMPAAFAADDLGKARTQLSASVDALDDVLRRYDAIVLADGGNGIRRVLGKLGPTSPLYRIDKAVNIVARDIDDDGAFELVDQFLGQIDAADGDAYSSIFVPTGGGTTPEYWLARSKQQIVKARATLGRIMQSTGSP